MSEQLPDWRSVTRPSTASGRNVCAATSLTVTELCSSRRSTRKSSAIAGCTALYRPKPRQLIALRQVGIWEGSWWRPSGAGEALTRARIAWVAERATEVWYYANAGNRASLALHAALGFEEVTREFTVVGVSFEGGVGVLCRAVLQGPSKVAPLGM